MSATLQDLFFAERVLAISAQGLEQLRARLEALTPDAAGASAGGRGRVPMTVIDGIAVLGLYGVLAHRPSWLLEALGGTSYLDFAQTLRQAVATKPRAIVLDIDSPGGSVRGLQELAQEVYDARRKSRLIAVANPTAASAAYGVAAQADELFVMPSGEVGSIGTIATHVDSSGRYERKGLRVRVFRSSNATRKSLGHPDEPLSDVGAAEIQRQLDHYAAVLVRDIARGRDVSTWLIERAFGQGAMFNSREAVQRGLADAVGTIRDVVAWLQAGGGEHPSATAARQRRVAQDLAMLEERVLRAKVRELEPEEDIAALERRLQRLQQPRSTAALRRELARFSRL